VVLDRNYIIYDTIRYTSDNLNSAYCVKTIILYRNKEISIFFDADDNARKLLSYLQMSINHIEYLNIYINIHS